MRIVDWCKEKLGIEVRPEPLSIADKCAMMDERMFMHAVAVRQVTNEILGAYFAKKHEMTVWQRDRFEEKISEANRTQNQLAFAASSVADYLRTLKNWLTDPPPEPKQQIPQDQDLTPAEESVIKDDLAFLAEMDRAVEEQRRQERKDDEQYRRKGIVGMSGGIIE